MHLVKLIANRALTGNYGHREAGEMLTTDNRTAESLEARGLARRYFPPSPVKVTAPPMQAKMTAPPENKMLTVGDNKGVPDWVKKTRSIPDGFDELQKILDEQPPPTKRGPGRPPGAKNKPKD